MIGTIVFYGFLALIAYGGFWELRENAKKERKRAPNGGKARGRYQKRLRCFVIGGKSRIAGSTGYEIMPS